MENNLTVRIKGNSIIIKMGEVSRELDVVNDFTDEVTQLAKLLLERRQEMLAKRRRIMLEDICNDKRGS